MEIHEAQTRCGEEIFLQQLAISHHHTEVGLKGDEVRCIGSFKFFRLEEHQTFSPGPGSDGVWANLLATPGRTVRLRIHGHYLGVGQGADRGESRERDLIRTE